MANRPLDRARLTDALALAEQSFGLTEPNPRVGCIIGDETGTVFGQGRTQQAGGPHAEVMALREAQAAGRTLRGATAWVTLEPCAHHGRTPPCCDALIEAGIGRTVVAAVDPFPGVAGAGIARLRAAGITVEMADPDLGAAAREVNIGFFSRFERGRPWVRLKVAASIDGRTALVNGVSQWITGGEARRDGHAWRRRASAVLSGIGTVLADDPRLDVRLVPSAGQPLRVVVDSRLRLPATARLLAPPGRVLVYTASGDAAARERLGDAGAEVMAVAAAPGGIDLRAVIADLGKRSINEIHVEAGAVLNASLLATGCVDEVLLYLAPLLVGPGRDIVQSDPLESLAAARGFNFIEIARIGPDLRVRMRPSVSDELTLDRHTNEGGSASS